MKFTHDYLLILKAASVPFTEGSNSDEDVIAHTEVSGIQIDIFEGGWQARKNGELLSESWKDRACCTQSALAQFITTSGLTKFNIAELMDKYHQLQNEETDFFIQGLFDDYEQQTTLVTLTEDEEGFLK